MSDDQAPMIDVLAFNCDNLERELWGVEDSQLRDDILFKYISNADKRQFEPIQDFQQDLDWFNVSQPLSMKALRGKIVVLDFFTYCCINCLHVLPDLHRLEQTYPESKGVIVIGVHSAKFENEKDSKNILAAIQKYNITHPVVNDATSGLWDALAIQCWPTMLVLGPRGNPLFVVMGEGHYQILQRYVQSALDFYIKQGEIKPSSTPLGSINRFLPSTHLLFPGKITCLKKEPSENVPELYALSDSGNNRILVFSAKGEVLHKIGGKEAGLKDGGFESALFNSPQGVTFLDQDTLFVADTENHAIRRVDLRHKNVETVGGTGAQGNDKVGGKIGLEQEISSPWDLVVYHTKDMDMSFHVDEEAAPEKYVLIIAMAGTHQIWALFLEDTIWWKYKKYAAGTLVCIAGNGSEENRNNSYPQNAAFAQPSGLAINHKSKEIYIADSESSSVRKISLTDGKVSAVVGGDRNPLNLFAFGDVDGKGVSAKLQHCLGVAISHKMDRLLVADSYNHKLKQVDLESSSVKTLKVTEKATREPYVFNEPSGMCFNPSADTLFICDTNNHAVLTVAVKGMEATPLELKFPSATKEPELGTVVVCAPIRARPDGAHLRVAVTLSLQDDTKLTEGAPQKFAVKVPEKSWIPVPAAGDLKSRKTLELEVKIPEQSAKTSKFHVSFRLNICLGNVCTFRNFALEFPVAFTEVDGKARVDTEVTVKVGKDVTV